MQVRTGFVAALLAVTAAAGTTTAVVGLPAASPAAPAAAPALPAAAQQQPSPLARSSRSRPIPVVRPLTTLRNPDLLVTLTKPLTTAQLAALRGIRRMSGLTVLDVGSVRLGAGRSVRVAGVDPSQFRQFTPRETAASDPLWQAVARGELAVTYGLSHARKLTLGGTTRISRQPTRIGAVAVYGVPEIDAVTSRATARSLGVVPGTAVLLAAPTRGITALKRAVREVIGDGAVVDVLRPVQVTAYRGKPRDYRELYIASARYCPGLRWQVLAAIGQVESGHGRNVGPSSAGALGPMQFLPSTWACSGVDGDGDGKADILNPFDAVPAAALYLCRAGAGSGQQGLYDAIFSYNHADWYVKLVLEIAARYR
ncbi:MAG: lytic transglycosylase domain-containing protein [Actinobacteria bacterium]|nr:lytic transglycosylase domain-containing protein [Actinomycetota bacterium]MCA1722581.1 lytic transglycosylase domain-containing protein [Actinomycetota bacterium]